MSKAPNQKWKLAAWPPGLRFTKDANGKTRSTVLWCRDYDNQASANRAAPGIHKRYPDAQIEVTLFVLKHGLLWVAESDATTKLYWCALCNARLNWIDDQWHCPKCGNEWHDEQVRPATTTSSN